MSETRQFEEYIGDGVYASFDGYQIWLRTQRLGNDWHEIALEPSVYVTLQDYVTRLRAKATKE